MTPLARLDVLPDPCAIVVDIERDGKNRELHVAADGTVVKDSDREAVGAPATSETGTDRK